MNLRQSRSAFQNFLALACFAGLALVPQWIQASAAGGAEPIQADIVYAQIYDVQLKLDLYLPESNSATPVIVWVHGGLWRSSVRGQVPIEGLGL